LLPNFLERDLRPIHTTNILRITTKMKKYCPSRNFHFQTPNPRVVPFEFKSDSKGRDPEGISRVHFGLNRTKQTRVIIEFL